MQRSGESLVMLRGPMPLSPDFAVQLAATRALLVDLGLELADSPQLAVWREQPFIYDWSDLQERLGELTHKKGYRKSAGN